MAIVTGNLFDFGGGPMAGLSPRLIFVPSGPGVTSDSIFAARNQIAYPDADGEFSVQLIENQYLRPVTWYTVRIEWLDPHAFGPDKGYVGKDFPDWKFTVPQGGGYIGELVNTPWNPVLAWWGPDEPVGDPVPSTLWLDTDNGILSIWSN